MSFTPISQIAPFWGWKEFTPALPDFYWDVYSAEQRIKKLCEEFHKLCEYANMLGDNINIDHIAITELQNAFDAFMESGFDDYYKAQVAEWISNNLKYVLDTVVRQVFFGLTDDGYFCAYVPDAWSDITFDTGMVYGRSDYGRLILKMNVEGEGVIDNTYSYSLNGSPTDLEQLVADLETVTRRGDASYKTLFTNMSEEVSDGNF